MGLPVEGHQYNPTPTQEKVTVKTHGGPRSPSPGRLTARTTQPTAPASTGTVSFDEAATGLMNTDWTSNAPPAGFPILCATTQQCGNSLASAYYNVIWGGRAPSARGAALRGSTWSSTGGTQNDVGSSSRYFGTELVSVPAFSHPVDAAKI